MFKCEGKKSYKKLDSEGIEFCPFYFEWECEKCNFYKGKKDD
jgi:hypothetical protein